MQQIVYSHPTIGQELSKAKEVINQFINSCSHSLRGPLKSITGINAILKQAVVSGNDDPIIYIDMISESVTRLESLLVQFEQFLESSKTNLTMEAVPLESLAEKVLSETNAISTSMNVDVDVQIDIQDHLYTDQHAFKLILLHLLHNAIIFHDENKKHRTVSVQIKVTRTSASINVVDNGIGVQPDIQSKIYDLFYRGSEKSVGTGVGLYMVQQILNKLGGSISLHSNEGEGSNFFVWIPNYSNLQWERQLETDRKANTTI